MVSLFLHTPSSSLSTAPQNPRSPNHLLRHTFASSIELEQLHAHLIKTTNFTLAQQILTCLQNQKPQIIAWNNCINLLPPISAISLFDSFRRFDLLPNAFTISSVLKACSLLPDRHHSIGRTIHGLVHKLGFGHNLFLENTLLHMYASCQDEMNAQLLFDQMPNRDVVTWNIMVTQFMKNGEMERARNLFFESPEKNIRSWTCLIHGYVQCGMPEEAVSIFLKMERETNLAPNQVTIVAILSACADLGLLDLGKRIHRYSNRKPFNANPAISNAAMDMYSKCGCLQDARKVFDEMRDEDRTVVSWSTLISALALHGQSQEALKIFSEMPCDPNEITFLAILRACSHTGLVSKGQEMFDLMLNYEITPRIEHYGCMVDLYSRAGFLNEAKTFIEKMPIVPNRMVWGALLGGCKIHKKIKMAEEIMNRIYEIEPFNDGYFVVLSNIYAKARMWDQVANLRVEMKKKGVKKGLAWSSISVDGVIHRFVCGEGGASGILEKLGKEMEERGYVADTSVVLLDVEEREKLGILKGHSERLALGFALENTKDDSVIRIIKNLRMCEDCHSAFKVISGIVGREIIVRDRSRFHCFKDGFCSCNDFW